MRALDLDSYDRQILNLVQRDASLTAEEMTRHIALSASAVRRRLKSLRDRGFIVANVAIVDPQKVGKPTFFVVNLEVERERPELLNKLRDWLRKRDEVQQVFWVTGAADFILVIAARDAESFDVMMSCLLVDNPNVRRFTTNVALGVVKRSLMLRVPLTEDAATDAYSMKKVASHFVP